MKRYLLAVVTMLALVALAAAVIAGDEGQLKFRHVSAHRVRRLDELKPVIVTIEEQKLGEDHLGQVADLLLREK